MLSFKGDVSRPEGWPSKIYLGEEARGPMSGEALYDREGEGENYLLNSQRGKYVSTKRILSGGAGERIYAERSVRGKRIHLRDLIRKGISDNKGGGKNIR